jgi:hypothetical protein
MCSFYKQGYFKNDEEARGAFRLADEQFLDGMSQVSRAALNLPARACCPINAGRRHLGQT